MAPAAIPPDITVPFELEMQCFKLPSWQEVIGATSSCCNSFENAGWQCVPGSGEYANADIQDSATADSICNYAPDYAFPVAANLEYDNADTQPRGSELPGACL